MGMTGSKEASWKINGRRVLPYTTVCSEESCCVTRPQQDWEVEVRLHKFSLQLCETHMVSCG